MAVISYKDTSDLNLAFQVAADGTSCTSSTYPDKWNCVTVTSVAGVEVPSSLVLYSDYQALVAYADNTHLSYAYIPLPTGTPDIQLVHDLPNVSFVSLALYQDVLWIAYSDIDASQYTLRLAHQVGSFNGNCGLDDARQCDVIDEDGSVG
ncbi:MAG: hypothetical protein MZV65_42095 [Chromatiales bacterium]|nr:hypothetical protein [Chromatiales bacterium]